MEQGLHWLTILSLNKYSHNWDLNIKPEDTAWEGRWKRTEKQNHTKIWRCDSAEYILSEEQVVLSCPDYSVMLEAVFL